jgi:hypothetical protein
MACRRLHSSGEDEGDDNRKQEMEQPARHGLKIMSAGCCVNR